MVGLFIVLLFQIILWCPFLFYCSFLIRLNFFPSTLFIGLWSLINVSTPKQRHKVTLNQTLCLVISISLFFKVVLSSTVSNSKKSCDVRFSIGWVFFYTFSPSTLFIGQVWSISPLQSKGIQSFSSPFNKAFKSASTPCRHITCNRKSETNKTI